MFYYDDVTVMSVINIKYGNVAIECILQGAAFCDSFCSGQKDLAPMPFTQKCVHCMVAIVLFDQQYVVGVRNLFRVEKVLLVRNNLAIMIF